VTRRDASNATATLRCAGGGAAVVSVPRFPNIARWGLILRSETIADAARRMFHVKPWGGRCRTRAASAMPIDAAGQPQQWVLPSSARRNSVR
jgi:hypothetical protein